MELILTKEEKKEAIILFKELFKIAYSKKGTICLAEHMLYNVIREVNPIRGIKNIRTTNICFAYYSRYYAQSWYYLPIKSKNAEFHIKLSKILGKKYDKILQEMPIIVSEIIKK